MKTFVQIRATSSTSVGVYQGTQDEIRSLVSTYDGLDQLEGFFVRAEVGDMIKLLKQGDHARLIFRSE